LWLGFKEFELSSTTLDFIRHGEPVGGRKYRGQIDDQLSEKGWAQMRLAVAGQHPWSRIVSSPLLRCRAFAEELAGRLQLPLTFDDRLKEVGFGTWEGKTAAQLDAEDPHQLTRFKADPLNARPPGAEPLQDFYSRVAAGLESLLQTDAGEHILLVCHAGVIRMALAHGLAIPLENAYRIEVPSAGLTRLSYETVKPIRAKLHFHGRLTLPA
jgi:alpha-ribazole phosphatase/probable phosphoglycerate mutase